MPKACQAPIDGSVMVHLFVVQSCPAVAQRDRQQEKSASCARRSLEGEMNWLRACRIKDGGEFTVSA